MTFWQVTLDMIFSADVPADLWVDILASCACDPALTDRIQDAIAAG